MTELKKDNKGYMYANAGKNNSKQPDFTGKATIEGKEKQIAVWENTNAEGKKYWSIIFSDPLPNNKPNQQTTSNNTNSSKNNYNSSISDDLDDLDAILRSADDENPFS